MSILDYLKNHIIIFDGGTGSLLQTKGLKPGEYPERWNLSHADDVTAVQQSYFDAGSNVITTNTFGANLLKYPQEELEQVVGAAVRIARKAAADSSGTQEKFVALDIGPLGRLLKPYGDLDFEEAVRIFAATVKAGAKEQPDLVLIETMNDSYETKAALLAVKENCDLPVFVSNTYGADGRLMTGADPQAMVAMLESMGADAIGVNCSTGPEELKPVVLEYLRYASVPVILEPNAGLPEILEGKTVYNVGPQAYADAMAELIKAGVRIAGGCCGTTPEHIRALVKKLNMNDAAAFRSFFPETKAGPSSAAASSGDAVAAPETAVSSAGSYMKDRNLTFVSSYTHAVSFGENPVIIGERINPTGKKRLKQALVERDLSYILNEADGQANAGSDVLDVNAGLPEINEAEMLPLLVKEIQTVTDLPLVIDTSDPKALEQALRIYNGKALINSVNGKQESMDRLFPLVKKYGGALIALTLDEKGIPETAAGRVEIAERIIAEAAKYGIPKKELIFDPLALTVSASPDAALVTLESVKRIHEELGACTSLGVSNISFGLPERAVINRTFLTMALDRGLSAAILNPYSGDMMETLAAYRLLKGLDTGCRDYIDRMAKKAEEAERTEREKAAMAVVNCGTGKEGTPISETAGKQQGNSAGSLQKIAAETHINALSAEFEQIYGSVTRGMKEQAARLAKEALTPPAGSGKFPCDPMELINEAVIPALNEVGEKFEQKKLFLPQLLLSAEAASAVFEAVKQENIRQTEETFANAGNPNVKKAGTIVLATVHGDIHDIGKGIVKLLLENYGFDVLDLGKDVPVEAVVEAVQRTHAPLCGLSALMTTTVPAMEATIVSLHKTCPETKIVVGGAVLTEKYAAQIRADRYAATAMDTVRYAREIIK